MDLPLLLTGRGGETGIRTGFRFQRRKACGFKSHPRHKSFPRSGIPLRGTNLLLGIIFTFNVCRYRWALHYTITEKRTEHRNRKTTDDIKGDVAKLVYALGLGPSGATCESSSLSVPNNLMRARVRLPTVAH